MDKFVFNLVVHEEWYEIPEFSSQEDLYKYIGKEISVKFDDYDAIYNYIDNWKSNHKFSVVRKELFDYDLERSYVIKEAVYTIDDKFYKLLYTECPYTSSEIWEEPCEVYPMEQMVTITEYFEK